MLSEVQPQLERDVTQKPRELSVDPEFEHQVLSSCPHCERTFLPDRLEIHLRSCKADKPLKPRIPLSQQKRQH